MLARLLKRHFWIVGAGSGLLCCVLAAQAANNVIDASYVDDGARVPRERAAEVPPPVHDDEASAARASATRSKNGEALAARNMFCSDCAPDEPIPAAGAAPADPLPWTALPLELVATNLSSTPESSFATVRNSTTGAQGSYFAGHVLPGAGAIERVSATYVVFHNPETSRLEKVGLLTVAQRTVPASAASPDRGRRTDASASTDSKNPHADRVKVIDATTFEIDRGLIPELMSKPRSGGAMIMPKGGGLKVSAVRKGGLAEMIGLKSGDSIQSIGGMSLGTPDEMMAAYTKLKDASQVEVAVTRGSEKLALKYHLR
jgi:general secretion pathway protein C